MDERIEIYHRMTGFMPSCFQQDLILCRVQDMIRWTRAIEFWCGNDYRAQSVLKVIEYYEKETKTHNTATVGRSEYTPPPVDCLTCNDSGDIVLPDPDGPHSGAVKFVPCPSCGGRPTSQTEDFTAAIQ